MERRNGTRITGDGVKVLFTYLYVLIVYGRASENVAYPDYQPKTEDRLAGRRRCSRVNKTHANMTRDAKSEIATACVSIAGKKRSSLKPRLEINSQHLATGRGCPTGTARSKLETIRKRSASEDQVTRVLPLSLADARSSLLLVTRYSLLAATRPREPRCCPLLLAVLSSFPLCFSQCSVTPSARVALHRLALSDRWSVRSFDRSIHEACTINIQQPSRFKVQFHSFFPLFSFFFLLDVAMFHAGNVFKNEPRYRLLPFASIC